MPTSIDLSSSFQSLEISRLPSPSPLSDTDPSPALTHKSLTSISNLELDLSLPSALSALIDHLITPLTRCYTPAILSALRLHLTSSLTDLFASSWDGRHPQLGSGFRSLICDARHGLPKPLRESAGEAGVAEDLWRHQLSKPVVSDAGLRQRQWAVQWEAWCDPGTVVWRYGGWEWEDTSGYDPFKVVRGEFSRGREISHEKTTD